MAGLILARVLEVMDRPWEWGTADCCVAPCDVFKRIYDIDPMAHLRGRYCTALGAARLMRDAGGLDALAEQCATLHGLREITEDRPGAIGVVADDMTQVLAICSSPGVWHGKTRYGLTFRPQAGRRWHV